MSLMTFRRLFCASVLASLLVWALPLPVAAAAGKLDAARDLQRDAKLAVGADIGLSFAEGAATAKVTGVE